MKNYIRKALQAQTATLQPSFTAAVSFSIRSVSDGDAMEEDVSGGNSVSGGENIPEEGDMK